MNVFVLCTGRCGSTTFAKACQHLTNFTAAHESRSRLAGRARFEYPDNHIEVDNRLSWYLGMLDRYYGDRAYYVHLLRDPEAVARSFALRKDWKHAILTAYHNGIAWGALGASRLDVARDYVATVNANISAFLKDKSNVMVFELEKAAEQFPRFLEWIGAEGDLKAACEEITVQHNDLAAQLAPFTLRSRIRRTARQFLRQAGRPWASSLGHR